jgi:hypothetical protein
MNRKTATALLLSHVLVAGAGFAGGIYVLPILTAPPAPDKATVRQMSAGSEFTATFSRDRQDSDAFHWGEGEVSIGPDAITFIGSLAPGPDYRLYLSPEFVETEADFNRLKPSMVEVGDVKTFENFIVTVPAGIDPSDYSAVIVWCESFGQYITSGAYEKRLR